MNRRHAHLRRRTRALAPVLQPRSIGGETDHRKEWSTMTVLMVAIGASLLAVMFLAMSLFGGPSRGGVAGSSSIFNTGNPSLQRRAHSRHQHASLRGIDAQIEQQYRDRGAPPAAA
jgi:hypothetical protein